VTRNYYTIGYPWDAMPEQVLLNGNKALGMTYSDLAAIVPPPAMGL